MSETLSACEHFDLQERLSAGACLNRSYALHFLMAVGRQPNAFLHRLESFGLASEQCLNMQMMLLFQITEKLMAHGADANGRDHNQNTPLHVAAEEPQHAVLILNLVKHGADLQARNLTGRTPLHGALRSLQRMIDGWAMRGLPMNHEKDDHQGPRVEAVLALLSDEQRGRLVAGVITARQQHLLEYLLTKGQHDFANDDQVAEEVFELMGWSDNCESMAWYDASAPHGRTAHYFDVPFCEYLPFEVRGSECSKQFVRGWCFLLRAVAAAVVARSLPTVSAVEAQLAEMSNSSTQTAEDIRMLCSAGIKVEHALDAVVSDAQASDIFWDCYSEDEELKEEYDSITEHPLDDDWTLLRYKLLGQLGRVPNGPFYK